VRRAPAARHTRARTPPSSASGPPFPLVPATSLCGYERTCTRHKRGEARARSQTHSRADAPFLCKRATLSAGPSDQPLWVRSRMYRAQRNRGARAAAARRVRARRPPLNATCRSLDEPPMLQFVWRRQKRWAFKNFDHARTTICHGLCCFDPVDLIPHVTLFRTRLRITEVDFVLNTPS
jgi:hypothetical protein